MSTQQQRQAWRELDAARTPGEWNEVFSAAFVEGEQVVITRLGEQGEADAAFIAAASTAVPALLADVDAFAATARNESALHGDTIMHNMYLRDELAKAKAERDALAVELATVRAQLAQARALFNVLDIGCDVNIKPSGPDYAVEVVSNLPRIGPAVIGFRVESSLFDAIDESCKQAVADLQARLH